MGQLARFEVEEHETLEQVVVKDKVDVEVLRFGAHPKLSGYKSKASAQLQ
jgi:hypothetical protein